jgi:hypothetical protein
MEVSAGSFVGSFPLEAPEAFGSHPDTIASRVVDGQDIRPHVRRKAGIYRPGDCLILMTDAVAQWFLRTQEGDRTCAARLIRMLRGDHGSLRAVLDSAREGGEMRNDDIGLLSVEYLPLTSPVTTPAP